MSLAFRLAVKHLDRGQSQTSRKGGHERTRTHVDFLPTVHTNVCLPHSQKIRFVADSDVPLVRDRHFCATIGPRQQHSDTKPENRKRLFPLPETRHDERRFPRRVLKNVGVFRGCERRCVGLLTQASYRSGDMPGEITQGWASAVHDADTLLDHFDALPESLVLGVRIEKRLDQGNSGLDDRRELFGRGRPETSFLRVPKVGKRLHH